MDVSATVYLNGEFLPAEEARVSVLDRGFIFADGVYEVIPVYNGRPLRLEHHLGRLDHSLQGIRIEPPLPHPQWKGIIEALIRCNGGGDLSLYLQITRGVAARDHRFPDHATPTVFAMTSPMEAVAPQLLAGVSAITVEDIRWQLCHIKSIALLPNILLRQQAVEQGASEAILLRDGLVTEGAATNVFMVHKGTVITPPKSNLLLPGITRDLVVELCRRHHIPCEEQAISAEQLRDADEVWLTSSTKEVLPVTRLDEVPVGSGQPGPLWRQLLTLYQDYKQALRDGQAD